MLCHALLPTLPVLCVHGYSLYCTPPWLQSAFASFTGYSLNHALLTTLCILHIATCSLHLMLDTQLLVEFTAQATQRVHVTIKGVAAFPFPLCTNFHQCAAHAT